MGHKEQTWSEEILHDPQHSNEFIAIREDRKDDGDVIGVIVAVGTIPDEVYGKLKEDQRVNESSKYFFARPMVKGASVKHHWTIKKEK